MFVVPRRLRLLLPLVACLAVLWQPLAALAAAGERLVVACCCPDPSTCRCADHVDHGGDASLRSCAPHREVTLPDVQLALAPVVATRLSPCPRPAAALSRIEPLRGVDDEPPEPPPF